MMNISCLHLFEIGIETVLRNIDRSWLIFASLNIFSKKCFAQETVFRSTTTLRRSFSDLTIYGHVFSVLRMKKVLRSDNICIKGKGVERTEERDLTCI